jgi:hypothetical protein
MIGLDHPDATQQHAGEAAASAALDRAWRHYAVPDVTPVVMPSVTASSQFDVYDNSSEAGSGMISR